MARRSRQIYLPLAPRFGHGGARRGAGRKPRRERPGVSHHGRERIRSTAPVHATLRVLPHVWNLRSARSFAVVARAVEGMKGWREFRVVHFSTLGDHLHFIVEADDARALSGGMQGLSVRLAKGLNRMMGRKGKVFADRFHAHVLRTPSEVRNALVYVLLNHRSHMARIGERVGPGALDRFSSAAAFDGWAGRPHAPSGAVVALPTTWLLRAGWKRRGLLSPDEVPALPNGRVRRGRSPGA